MGACEKKIGLFSVARPLPYEPWVLNRGSGFITHIRLNPTPLGFGKVRSLRQLLKGVHFLLNISKGG